MPQLRAREHLVEGIRQMPGQRPVHVQSYVAPAARHAITHVFRRVVEPADEGHLLVAHQQLAVVAEQEPAMRLLVEPAELSPRLAQRLPVTVRQILRAPRIQHHIHLRAAPLRPHQGFEKAIARVTRAEDVSLQPHGVPRRLDGGEHGCEGFVPVAEPVERCVVWGGDHVFTKGRLSLRRENWRAWELGFG